MLLKDLQVYVNDAIVLRKPNDTKVAEYAERMSAGVKFPPIVIGTWPESEKYGKDGIVDGLHRLQAAAQAKLADLEVEHKKFHSLEEALEYMYTANMAHGLPVTEGQRNARIRLLKKIDPKLTTEKIGKQFGLHQTSVSRILAGEQGEGKSGPKGGAQKSKGQKSQDRLKPKAFFAALERIDYTCTSARAVKDIIEYAMPETEEGCVVDPAKLKLIQKVQSHLKDAVQELS